MPEPQVILITGASTGIGKACAEYLGARGHRVYGTSRRAPDGVTASGSFNLLRMDVTRQGSVEGGIELVMAREGRIDAVMNNAGLHSVGPLERMGVADIEESFQTNCLGALRVCKAVVPAMRSRGSGRIINMSSIGGAIPLPFQGAYSLSKSALEAMTEVLRAELGPFGILVSIIEPGDIRHQDCHSRTEAGPEYEAAFSRAMAVAWADEEKGYPPERIGPLVERILRSRRPRTRYTFGPAYQAAALVLKRFLPPRLAELALGAYYRL